MLMESEGVGGSKSLVSVQTSPKGKRGKQTKLKPKMLEVKPRKQGKGRQY